MLNFVCCVSLLSLLLSERKLGKWLKTHLLPALLNRTLTNVFLIYHITIYLIQ